jgi:hypothetical protein
MSTVKVNLLINRRSKSDFEEADQAFHATSMISPMISIYWNLINLFHTHTEKLAQTAFRAFNLALKQTHLS